MSTADFQVLYGTSQEAIERLRSRVTELSNALDDLNAVLNTIDSQFDGRAKGLWQGEQQAWNSKYVEMAQNLGANSASVNRVVDIYNDGDLSAASLFNT